MSTPTVTVTRTLQYTGTPEAVAELLKRAWFREVGQAEHTGYRGTTATITLIAESRKEVPDGAA